VLVRRALHYEKRRKKNIYKTKKDKKKNKSNKNVKHVKKEGR